MKNNNKFDIIANLLESWKIKMGEVKMKNIFMTKIIAVALTSVTFLTILPKSANAQWKDQGENKYYTNADGSNQKGWQQIDGKWYYFDETTGVMVRDATVISTCKEYKLGADGAWINGKPSTLSSVSNAGDNEGLWILKNGKWYFENKAGVVQKDTTITYDGKQYKLDENGVVNQNGVFAISNEDTNILDGATAHVAATDGEWVYDEETGHTYFRDASGKNKTGWIAYGQMVLS